MFSFCILLCLLECLSLVEGLSDESSGSPSLVGIVFAPYDQSCFGVPDAPVVVARKKKFVFGFHGGLL